MNLTPLQYSEGEEVKINISSLPAGFYYAAIEKGNSQKIQGVLW
ncbi:MAG: hypothetical protein NT007_11830 [Candidatus Kapabacteria bacterium]|nr:hypothetical protein [Candidatus Kapabacteria bacterium]